MTRDEISIETFKSKEGVAKLVFAMLQHTQAGGWLTPKGMGFNQAHHQWRDYIDVVIGKHKYGVGARTIKVYMAAERNVYPVTEAAKDVVANGGRSILREHAVPSIILWNIAKRATKWEDCLIIIDLFTMVIMTREQDKMISLKKAMPEGWKVGDSVLARYEGLPFHSEVSNQLPYLNP